MKDNSSKKSVTKNQKKIIAMHKKAIRKQVFAYDEKTGLLKRTEGHNKKVYYASSIVFTR